ncbi:S9 family peptidase [Nesterenkonia massiliensis]|uniref:S9 family peptidase n=1 Tax=Nesterenkonia massiliensis TaxID=1232429 RepID=A0ABT2HQ14_9MICC|nr:S9 family peptidase [Nesterenkonia massiliensis]MCT1606768.1 S9 family peptidase [Nesterenkonia massiliensis]
MTTTPASSTAQTPQAPRAKQVPTERTHHGETFIDPYEWLREKESPEVISHLESENSYTEAVTAEQQPLREAIFAEIKHRTVETDLSVPERRGQWWYFARTIEGEQHPVFCRVPVQEAVAGLDTGAGGLGAGGRGAGGLGAEEIVPSELSAWTPPQVEPGVPLEGEQTYFDTNAEASQHPFYSLGGMSINDAGTLLAYSEDTSGDEHYTLRFRDLESGENLAEVVENVHGGPTLDPTGERAYYLVADASWRPYRLYEHIVGTSAQEDRLLLEVEDEQLWSAIWLAADKRELIIYSGNSEYNETRILDLFEPGAQPVLLIGKDRGLEHNIEPFELDGERLLLITHNQHGPNKSVSLTTAGALLDQADNESLDLGRTVLEHEDTVKLDDSVTITAAQILVAARVNTIQSVYLLPLDTVRQVRDGGAAVKTSSLAGPQFDEELFTCSVSQAEYDAPLFRVSYTSWLTPPRVYDIPHEPAGGSGVEPLLRRETPVNDVDLDAYRATRVWAPAPDGEHVPVTVLHHRDVAPGEGGHPTLVYGYGSYEISMDPQFGIARLSLLDRGVVFAVAHIRGGGELGRKWYDDGKKLKKINTFTDFIAATDYLVDTGWADPVRVAALGGSAGGLLMGAVANMAPEKYVAILAQVPFVDNLTSILDPDLPLSALEWEEWGNPITDPEVYQYMKSYSPYENVRDTEYPAIAAVTSLHDTRVLYVEPAKWVQKLREHQQAQAPIVLKIEMDGGHGGASGRYEQWKDRAWDYAFVAHWLGATERRF